jgi:hypothetical protein
MFFGESEGTMNRSSHSNEPSNETAQRTTVAVVRATVAVGSIVALIASVGAPFKWY